VGDTEPPQTWGFVDLPKEHTMSEGVKTIIYPVRDLEAAKALYGGLLGVEPYADELYYVGYKVGGQDVGLDPNGHKKGITGAVAFHHVEDIKGTLQGLIDAGAQTIEDVHGVGGGRLIATAKDADGNVIGLVQDT
jgi:predicted enzyme related to lactoylglutathione lyase